MATQDGHITYDELNYPKFPSKQIAVVCTEWNREISDKLLAGALKALKKAEVERIISIKVPGAYEIPYACQKLAQKNDVDGIVTLGAIIQGETKHFDFISQAVSQGVMTVSLKYSKPITFGIITPNNLEQAEDRAGGKLGNKGFEAALSLLKILNL